MNPADPRLVDRADRLARVVEDLASLAAEHPACLRCHCYREVAVQAVEAGAAAGVGEPAALRHILAGTEAGHG